MEDRHNTQPDVTMGMVELRCDRRLHAVLDVPIIEIHCRYCSGTMRVFHRWDITSGERLDDRTEHLATQVIPVQS